MPCATLQYAHIIPEVNPGMFSAVYMIKGNGVPLFIISASMSKRDGMMTTSTIMQGYRLMDTKEQAAGDFLLKATDTRPGFSIDQVICMEVEPGHIAAAHAAQSGINSNLPPAK